jgi:hypothetical protein
MIDIEFDITGNLDLDFDTDPINIQNTKFNKGIKKTLKKNKQPIIVRSLVKKINEKAKIPTNQILQINSKAILDYIPDKNQTSFFLMDGNCVFLDFILAIIFYKEKMGYELKDIYLTSLSLNSSTFDKINSKLQNIKINLLISSYWLTVDKSSILETYYRQGLLKNYNIGYYRNHTKIVLLEFKNKDITEYYTLSGSANLRSSNTLEQFVIIEDQEIHNFNKEWISDLIKNYRYDFENKNDFNTPSNF